MYDIFSLSKTWQDYDAEEQIKQKVDKIFSLIPNDVINILDVGCGNGIITNELHKKWDITGLDSSSEALKYVQGSRINASATQIPFPNCSFDMVLSSEMLEHLTDADLAQAVQELKRVSKRYVLLTVPNSEFLPASFVKCPDCQTIFHAWYHIQSFDNKRLDSFFKDEYRVLHKDDFGPLQKKWIPVLLKLKQNSGQWLSPGNKSICPMCGKTDFSLFRSSIVTKLCNGLNLLLAGKKPYWSIMLLEKKA